MHRAIGDLGSELVVGEVQRGERERLQLRRRRVAEVRRQPIEERGNTGAEPAVGLIPAEHTADLPAHREQRAHGE